MNTPFFAPDGTPQSVSDEAKTMVEQGAAPTQPDVNALLAQMQDLQNRVASMQAERGIPADPVEFALSNLRAHVLARKNATGVDVTEIVARLDKADTSLSPTNAELLALSVDDLVDANPAMEYGAYLRQLARDVRKAVLVRDGKSEEQAALSVRGVAV